MTLPGQSDWFPPKVPSWSVSIEINDQHTPLFKQEREGKGLEVLSWATEVIVPEIIRSLANEPCILEIRLVELP